MIKKLATALILIYLFSNSHNSANTGNAQNGTFFSETWSINVGSTYHDLSICDLDRDGNLEIIFHGGTNLYCLNSDGTVKWIVKDQHVAERFSLADINEDGKLDFIIPTLSGEIVCIDHNGRFLWEYKSVDYSMYAYPCIADINKDGDLEIIINSRSRNPFILDKKGHLYKKINLNITTTSLISIHSTPIVVDIDLNDEIELLIVSSDGYLYCLNHEGSKIWSVKLRIGLIDANSKLALVKTSENKINIVAIDFNEVLCLNNTGQLQWKYILHDSYQAHYLVSSDINNDGVTETLFAGYLQDNNSGILYCLDSAGNRKWSYNLTGFPREPMLADITGDEREEIIFTTETKIYCLNSSGGVEYIYENDVQGGKYVASRITDIDNDNFLDIITATDDGKISCMKILTSFDSSSSWWTYQGTNQHYGQPDRDGDGLDDLSETIIYNTDSHREDSDNDGLPDSWEIEYGLNPLLADAQGDMDGDGLNNLKEFSFAKNPRNWDNWPRLFVDYFSPIWVGMLVAIVNFYRKNKHILPKIIKKSSKR